MSQTERAAHHLDANALVRLGRVGAFTVQGDRVVVAVERLDAMGATGEAGSRFVSDLWAVPLDGGAATRLTRGDCRDRAPRASGEVIYFLSDRKVGKEDEAKTQVWALPRSGEPYPVTREPLGVGDFRVAGRVLVVMTDVVDGVAREALAQHEQDRKKHGPSVLHYKTMPVRYWDHWLGPARPTLIAYELETDPECRSPRDLVPDGPRLGGEGPGPFEVEWDLSADGRTVVVAWTTMNPTDRVHDKALALIDIESAERRLVGRADRVVNTGPRCVGDGVVAGRYRRKDDGYGARTLWVYGDSERELTAGWDRWPTPVGERVAGGERRVVVTYEERGRVRLAEVDEQGGIRVLGPETFEGDPYSFEQVEVVGELVVATVSRLLHPPELVRLDLSSGVLTRLASLSGCGPTDASYRELDVPVSGHESNKERAVHTLVVEPARPNGKTILWIHGGPVAAWGHRWHGRWCARLMADRGFRVVLPNPAGSTGYGLGWVDDVWGNTWGGQCYRDVMAVAEYLENQGIRSADTIVMGGSFGGYMTNWIGGQTNRFGLLITHASLYSLSGFQGDTDMPSWWELMTGIRPGDPELDRFSPSRNVANWKTPTLILHGEKDYRVPIGEGLALFEALTRQGTDAELVVFPDENHWILKPRNIIAWYGAVLDFIERKWPARPTAVEAG